MNRLALAIPILFLLISPSVLAARSGVIDVDEGEVHDAPNETAHVLETLKRGDQIRASNEAASGFYKVRTPSGIVGWISEEALKLASPEYSAPYLRRIKEERIADEGAKLDFDDRLKLQKSKGFVEKRSGNLKVFGETNFFSAPDVIVNSNTLTPGFSYGAEVGFEISSRFDVLFRAEKFFKTVILNDSITTRTFQVDLTAVPVMIGLQFEAYRVDHFLLQLSAMAGMTFQTGLQSTVISSDSPSATRISFLGNYFTFLGKLNFLWFISRNFGFYLEGGYRFLQCAQFSGPNVPGSGTDILRPNFNLNLSGPVMGVGFGFAF